MATTGYKPGLLIELLGISREQLRYWRRHLDPVPSRPVFSYQMLLGYAVFREWIVERWLEPRRLKGVNLRDFFLWFEHHHSDSELKDTVICLDKHAALLRFQSVESFRQSALTGDRGIEVVYLRDVEAKLLARFREHESMSGSAVH